MNINTWKIHFVIPLWLPEHPWVNTSVKAFSKLLKNVTLPKVVFEWLSSSKKSLIGDFGHLSGLLITVWIATFRWMDQSNKWRIHIFLRNEIYSINLDRHLNAWFVPWMYTQCGYFLVQTRCSDSSLSDSKTYNHLILRPRTYLFTKLL